MRLCEWVALVYFVYIAAAALAVPRAKRVAVAIASLLCAALVRAGAGAPSAIRDWLPVAYILAGYYFTGWLFVAPAPHLESWLLAWDRRLLGNPSTRFASWPRPLVSALEVVYMGCFLIVPGGFALLATTGHSAVADRYWTIVVASEFAAFAPLSVFQTRPPWAIDGKPVLTDPAMHAFASRVVRTITIRVNTFPSGHAAGSLAVAFAVLPVLPAAGAVLLALALAICIACFVCRYHYIIDVVAGALVAVAVWAAVWAARV